MKILITGSSGFIGQHIVKNLSKEKIVLLTSKSSNKIKKKKFIYKNYDLKKGFIPKLECDILIHAAGITPQKKYRHLEYKKINYNGLKNILGKIKIKKKLIFLSTTDIYKNKFTKEYAKENTKVNFSELSSYAKSKYLCEEYLKDLDIKKFPFKKIILRLPAIIGIKNHKNFISNIANNIIKRKKIIFFGGENLYNNIYHVEHLADFIGSILKKKITKNYVVINVAANKPIKIKNIFKLFRKNINISEMVSNNKKNYSFVISVSNFGKYYKKISTLEILLKYFKSYGIKLM